MEALWIYGIAGVVALVLLGIAISSRKSVTCASCHERVQMEHDRITHCPSCGAPLPR